MYKYKTKNGKEVVIPGVGQTVDGVIVSHRKLNNRNLELIGSEEDGNMNEEEKKPEVPQTPPQPPVQSTAQPQVAAPGAVIGVAPQATQPAAPVQPSQNNQEQN